MDAIFCDTYLSLVFCCRCSISFFHCIPFLPPLIPILFFIFFGGYSWSCKIIVWNYIQNYDCSHNLLWNVQNKVITESLLLIRRFHRCSKSRELSLSSVCCSATNEYNDTNKLILLTLNTLYPMTVMCFIRQVATPSPLSIQSRVLSASNTTLKYKIVVCNTIEIPTAIKLIISGTTSVAIWCQIEQNSHCTFGKDEPWIAIPNIVLMIEIPSEINVSHVTTYSRTYITNTYMLACVMHNKI